LAFPLHRCEESPLVGLDAHVDRLGGRGAECSSRFGDEFADQKPQVAVPPPQRLELPSCATRTLWLTRKHDFDASSHEEPLPQRPERQSHLRLLPNH
jgi:hypothetical protein